MREFHRDFHPERPLATRITEAIRVELTAVHQTAESLLRLTARADTLAKLGAADSHHLARAMCMAADLSEQAYALRDLIRQAADVPDDLGRPPREPTNGGIDDE